MRTKIILVKTIITWKLFKNPVSGPTVKFWALGEHWATGHLEKWALGYSNLEKGTQKALNPRKWTELQINM